METTIYVDYGPANGISCMASVLADYDLRLRFRISYYPTIVLANVIYYSVNGGMVSNVAVIKRFFVKPVYVTNVVVISCNSISRAAILGLIMDSCVGRFITKVANVARHYVELVVDG